LNDEDTKFLLHFKGGNSSAFEYLFDKYYRRLINFIYRFIGNQSEAEDLAQEVFIKAYQYKDRYEPTAKFST